MIPEKTTTVKKTEADETTVTQSVKGTAYSSSPMPTIGMVSNLSSSNEPRIHGPSIVRLEPILGLGELRNRSPENFSVGN